MSYPLLNTYVICDVLTFLCASCAMYKKAYRRYDVCQPSTLKQVQLIGFCVILMWIFTPREATATWCMATSAPLPESCSNNNQQ